MIRGINHITLSVGELERSIRFYVDVLGFEQLMESDRTAYFLAGNLWFCVVQESVEEGAGRPDDYSHIAFDIDQDDYPAMATRIAESGAKVFKENITEGDSLYFLDPDGHKLEIHSGSWQSRMEAIRRDPWGDVKLFR